MKRPKWGFWVFIAPALIAFILVQLIPAFTGIYYSFTDWNGIGNEVSLVGIRNYADIFEDSGFWRSFLFTAVFAACAVVSLNVVGFFLALLVTQAIPLRSLMRSVFFLPNLIGGILLGFTWQFIFTQAFDSVGKALGIPWLQGWLSTPATAALGLLILVTWQLSGYMMIIYIAQIQNIPDSVMEAAQIDGANGWHRLTKIILPLVAPAFTIGLFLSLTNSFKMYDQNLSLTGGGPYHSTEMLAMNIYNSAFKFNQLGIAQAKAVLFLIVVAAISLTQLYLSKKREVEM